MTYVLFTRNGRPVACLQAGSFDYRRMIATGARMYILRPEDTQEEPDE